MIKNENEQWWIDLAIELENEITNGRSGLLIDPPTQLISENEWLGNDDDIYCNHQKLYDSEMRD